MCDGSGELNPYLFSHTTKYIHIFDANNQVSTLPLSFINIPANSQLYHGSEDMAENNVELPLGMDFYVDEYDIEKLNPRDSSIITVMKNRKQHALQFTGLRDAKEEGVVENGIRKNSVFALKTVANMLLLYFDANTVQTLKRMYDRSVLNLDQRVLVVDNDILVDLMIAENREIPQELEAISDHLHQMFRGDCNPHGLCVSPDFNYNLLYLLVEEFRNDFFFMFNVDGYYLPNHGIDVRRRHSDDDIPQYFLDPILVLHEPFMFIERDYSNKNDFLYEQNVNIPILETLKNDLKEYIVTNPNEKAGNLYDNSVWAVQYVNYWITKNIAFTRFATTDLDKFELEVAAMLFNIGNAGDRHNPAVNTKTGRINFFGPYKQDFSGITVNYLFGGETYYLADGSAFKELPNLLYNLGLNAESQMCIYFGILLHDDFGVLSENILAHAKNHNDTAYDVYTFIMDILDDEYPVSDETFDELDMYVKEILGRIVEFKRYVRRVIARQLQIEKITEEYNMLMIKIINIACVLFITSKQIKSAPTRNIITEKNRLGITIPKENRLGLTGRGRVYKGGVLSFETGQSAYGLQQTLQKILMKESLYANENLDDE